MADSVAIVGMPRCGTTSLYVALSRYNFATVLPKEWNPWAEAGSDVKVSLSDGNWLLATADLIAYKQASVWLAESRCNVVVIVRHPVDRLVSAFRYAQRLLRIGTDLSLDAYVEQQLESYYKKGWSPGYDGNILDNGLNHSLYLNHFQNAGLSPDESDVKVLRTDELQELDLSALASEWRLRNSSALSHVGRLNTSANEIGGLAHAARERLPEAWKARLRTPKVRRYIDRLHSRNAVGGKSVSSTDALSDPLHEDLRVVLARDLHWYEELGT